MNSAQVRVYYTQIIEYLRLDPRSDADIARRSGVSQPTVWRLRNGAQPRLRFSEQFNKLCNFYGLTELKPGLPDSSLESELKGAIMAIWDGSDAHARALIKVIRSLKGLATTQPDQSVQLTAEGGRNAGHTN
jgi:transcriptional regulator with XRE-family HTH domain